MPLFWPIEILIKIPFQMFYNKCCWQINNFTGAYYKLLLMLHKRQKPVKRYAFWLALTLNFSCLSRKLTISLGLGSSGLLSRFTMPQLVRVFAAWIVGFKRKNLLACQTVWRPSTCRQNHWKWEKIFLPFLPFSFIRF